LSNRLCSNSLHSFIASSVGRSLCRRGRQRLHRNIAHLPQNYSMAFFWGQRQRHPREGAALRIFLLTHKIFCESALQRKNPFFVIRSNFARISNCVLVTRHFRCNSFKDIVMLNEFVADFRNATLDLF